jgi:CHAP domain
MIALARWLPTATPDLNRRIVVRALSDIGIVETPPGSNRSGVIDSYNLAAGVPVGSYWCAAAVAAWYRESGAKVPPGSASCDSWMAWAKAAGQWKTTPTPGAAVVYGTSTPLDATHIGVVVRVGPLLLSCEGNTSLGGFSRNGVAVDLKLVNTDRLLGYVWPIAAP